VRSAEDDWPVPDASVDVVLGLAMLEFVEHLDAAFDEIARCLVPFGRALVTVEDIVDADGHARPEREDRYGRVPLWRRSWDDVDLCVPPGLQVVRHERCDAYRVLELGFTCAYHVIEFERRADV
jgi:ubiquinone/menaquinone biosynthesis C-methylase UbiE